MSALLPAEIVKPAKHGFVIDMLDGERRVHVRVFEFEEQQVTPTVRCEMPVTIDEAQAIARLRQAMECLRERVVQESGERRADNGEAQAGKPMLLEGGAS